MQCPVDQTTLVMTERQGVEIDYCPTCRGVWLDRGELDKIIERSDQISGSGAPAAARHTSPSGRDEFQSPTVGGMHGKIRPLESVEPYDDDRDHYDEHRGQGRRKKKRGSFLEDLFDFE